MPEVTYYVALPFVDADDGIAPAEAVECFNPNAAGMRAEVLSRRKRSRRFHAADRSAWLNAIDFLIGSIRLVSGCG